MVSTVLAFRRAHGPRDAAGLPLRLRRQHQPLAHGPGHLQRRDRAVASASRLRAIDGHPIRAVSAGLTASHGRPFTDASIVTLRGMNVLPHAHASRPVTAELVAEADVLFCMTEDQRCELIARFPEAAGKVHRLDPDGDIDDPSGRGEDAYRVMAARFQELIRLRLDCARNLSTRPRTILRATRP